MTGKMPAEVDHINRDKLDNRWSNLRPVSHTLNQRNHGGHQTNTSGVNGVCWHKHRNKWQAHIWVDGKNKHLGYFDCIEEAAAARKQAEIRHWGGVRETAAILTASPARTGCSAASPSP